MRTVAKHLEDYRSKTGAFPDSLSMLRLPGIEHSSLAVYDPVGDREIEYVCTGNNAAILQCRFEVHQHHSLGLPSRSYDVLVQWRSDTGELICYTHRR